MHRALAVLLALAAAGLILWSRLTPPALPQAEGRPGPAPARPSPPTFASPSPPTSSEVETAVERVFRGAARIAGGAPPLAGDFNGDGSMDLAVVVRPDAGSLEAFNGAFPNWIAEAPRRIQARDPARAVSSFEPQPAPVLIGSEGLLLAVIHGSGELGWRNPAARQTFVLVGVVGGGMTTAPLKERLAGAPVARSRADLRGDGIVVTLPDGGGYLYWDGARYGWLAEGRKAGR
jgi:hypothetical protein